MTGRTFYTLSGSFLGVVALRMAIGPVWGLTIAFPVWLLFLAGVMLLLVLALKKYARFSVSILLLLAGVFFIAGIAFMRVGSVINQDQETTIENIPTTSIEVLGNVVGDRDNRQANAKFLLDADTVIVAGKEYPVTTRVLVTSERFEKFHAGDKVSVVGRLQEPQNFVTDTGKEFDYQAYLWKNDIRYVMYYPNVEVLHQGSGGIARNLFALKNTLITTTNKYISQPEGALLSGVLFGDKAGLGPDLQDAFRRSGLIHIIVLSGFNISIISYFLFVLFSRAPKRIAIILSAISIIAFAVMVGGGPTVVRASIMALLVLVALSVGRTYDIMRALWFAAVVMVFLNPKILLSDISFQLSFLATFGLIIGAPYFDRMLAWFPSIWGLRGHLVATVTTQVFVLPLLIMYTGEVSVIAIVVNLFVLPIVPLVMLLGLFVAITGLFWSGLASVIAVPTWLLLRYITGAVEVFADFKFASVRLPTEGLWIVLLLYVCVFGYVLHRRQKESQDGDLVTPWEVSAREVAKLLKR
jgi:competence protein ComEC